MAFVFRPYQKEAIARTIEQVERSGRAMIHMATGLGKTAIGRSITGHYARQGTRVLWLAHRKELLDQAHGAIQCENVTIDMEQSERTAPANLFDRGMVCIATVQTMCGPRRFKYAPNHFGLIVIDEAHHAAAKSYRTILARFPEAKVIGLSATPYRSDGIGLQEIFGSVSYSMPLVRGWSQGWLVDMIARNVPLTGFDIDAVKVRRGELSQTDLERIVEDRGDLAVEMARRTMDIAGDRRSLGFCVSVRHAILTAEAMNRYAGRRVADFVHGQTRQDVRDNIFKAFSQGEIQHLLNVDIATEGWDDPAEDGRGVQVISIMRPTMSRARLEQMMGRGTRPLPGCLDGLDTAEPKYRRRAIEQSAKPSVEFLDFVGATRHDIARPTDVLAGRPLTPIESRNVRIASQDGISIEDIEEACERAHKTAEQIEAQRRAEARETVRIFQHAKLPPIEAVARNIFAESKKKAEYAARVRRYARGMATDKQINLAVKLGVPREAAKSMTKAEISDAIDRANRATERQVRYMRALGIPGDVEQLNRWEASRLINAAIELQKQKETTCNSIN